MTGAPNSPPPAPQPSWESAPVPPGMPPGHVPEGAPGGGGGASKGVGALPPLEDPSGGSIGQRSLSTLRELLLRPGDFFERVGNSEKLGWPLLFGVVVSTVGRALHVGSTRLFGSSVDAMLARVMAALAASSGTPLPATAPHAPRAELISGATSVALMPVFFLISLFVSAAVVHVGLQLAGGAKRSLMVTVRVFAYASVAHMVAFVPVIGPLAAGAYVILLQAVGVSRAHRTTIGRSLFAVLVPELCACACAGAAMVALGAFLGVVVGATLIEFIGRLGGLHLALGGYVAPMNATRWCASLSAVLSLSAALGACDQRAPIASPPAPPAGAGCAEMRSPGAFELGVLGSGGPASFGRAASSYVVFVEGVARILVDAGPGAFVRLGEAGVDLGRLDTILLTHLHIDHSGDLPGVVKSRDLRSNEPLTFRVFGPGGGGDYPGTAAFVERLFGPQGAFAYLQGFRNPLRLAPVELPTSAGAPIHEVLREGDLRVTSIAVDHGDVPAVAYRVEHAGHALVVSGDLASKNDNLVKLAEGADVLVYDTTVLEPSGRPGGLYDLHTRPSRIGEVAEAAHVKELVLSHIPPGVEAAQAEVLGSVRTRYHGETRLASDCMRVDLSGTVR
jgi:ribonuclease BN (tRNA processing enzyme)